MDDFARRTGLGRAAIARLAKAGVFESLELDRRNALWEALGQDQRELPLFEKEGGRKAEGGRGKAENSRARILDFKSQISHSQFQGGNEKSPSPFPLPPSPLPPSPLPPMSPAEEVLADYRAAGLSLRAHPLSFLRDDLAKRKVAPAESLQTLPNGGFVSVAGIVLVRQRPGTAKGITFVTLEDETGTANLIVRPAVWKRYRQAALGATLLLASGRLQRHGQVIHILTTRLENLSPWLEQLASQSRDFC
jgi:error-prone DNA polymerase